MGWRSRQVVIECPARPGAIDWSVPLETTTISTGASTRIVSVALSSGLSLQGHHVRASNGCENDCTSGTGDVPRGQNVSPTPGRPAYSTSTRVVPAVSG